MATDQKSSLDDHDLLIRLDTRVEGLILAIQSLNDNTIKRLEDVESQKAGRDELNVILEGFTKNIEKEEKQRIEADQNIDLRMRSAERFVYIAMGVAIVLQIVVLPVVLKYFNN